MPTSEDAQTFVCTTCTQVHPIIPDTLPPGPSGHKSHCAFCLLHTLYRSIIPAAPTSRPTDSAEQMEKNNVIRTRKLVLGIIIPVAVLACFAFRWQMAFWPRVAHGVGHGEKQMKEGLLWLMLCIIGVAPCGFVLGFLSAGAYYVFWSIKKKKKRAKKRKSEQGSVVEAFGGLDAVPLEEKPLSELRFCDLQEAERKVEIVVTPPVAVEEDGRKVNRMSRMLSVVTGGFGKGYDGRSVRKESWVAMNERDEGSSQRGVNDADRTNFRPTTEWPPI